MSLIPAARIALLLGLITLLAGSGGCGRQQQVPSATPQASQAPKAQQAKPASKQPLPGPPDTTPDIRFVQTGITLKWTEKGKTRMSAKARRLEGNEVTQTGVLLDFSAELYENGKPTTTMTAPKVIADNANRTVLATGGVVMKSVDRSTVVKSGWAKWFSKEQRIVGDGGVKATSTMGTNDHYEMQGAAFETDTALKTVKIRNSAKGLVYK